MQNHQRSPLVCAASRELEDLRSVPKLSGARFPAGCRKLMMSLPGNSNCIDCGSVNPEWASVTFGTLICTRCSGRHRSYGVQTSFVRSVRMDTWNYDQVLAMLEGGNGQLKGFFDRHQLGNSSDPSLFSKRYHTKAAKFYRINLSKHVENVSDLGPYQGREASRGRRQAEQETLNKRPSSSGSLCGQSSDHSRNNASLSPQSVSVQ